MDDFGTSIKDPSGLVHINNCNPANAIQVEDLEGGTLARAIQVDLGGCTAASAIQIEDDEDEEVVACVRDEVVVSVQDHEVGMIVVHNNMMAAAKNDLATGHQGRSTSSSPNTAPLPHPEFRQHERHAARLGRHHGPTTERSLLGTDVDGIYRLE